MQKSIRIYQSFYEDFQAQELDPAFTPYDVKKSPFPKLYEIYWLMKLHDSGSYREIDYCGLMSWKFGRKTGLSGNKFIDFINLHPGFDVYFLNPYPCLAYRFFNVWDQGERAHKGIIALAQKLMDEAGYGISVADVGRNGRDTLLYCNFWVGNKRFWDSYISFIRPLYNHCLHDNFSGESNPFFSVTTHSGRDVPFFPFIFERLFSTFLLYNNHIAFCPYRHTTEEILRSCKYPKELEIVRRLGFWIDELDRRMRIEDTALHRRLFQEIHSGDGLSSKPGDAAFEGHPQFTLK